MFVLKLSGESGSYVILDIKGFENVKTDDEDDAKWLRAHVNIKVSDFTANFNATFVTSDFSCFLEELKKVLNKAGNGSKAVFSTYEEWLQLSVQIHKTGVVKIDGVAKTHAGKLSFLFNSDLCTLNNFCVQLQSLCGLSPDFEYKSEST